MPQVIY